MDSPVRAPEPMGADHPSFKDANELRKRSHQFMEDSGEYAKRKYPKGFNMIQLREAVVEYYIKCQDTKMPETQLDVYKEQVRDKQ